MELKYSDGPAHQLDKLVNEDALTMAPIIRRATSADISVIAEIWNSAWHDAHDLICHRELIAARTLASFSDRAKLLLPSCLVICIGTQVVGFGSWHHQHLDNLFVHAAYRGRNHSQALLSAIEEQIGKAGFHEASLTCAAGNERALCFYLKRGWQDVGFVIDEVQLGSGPLLVSVHVLRKSLMQPLRRRRHSIDKRADG